MSQQDWPITQKKWRIWKAPQIVNVISEAMFILLASLCQILTYKILFQTLQKIYNEKKAQIHQILKEKNWNCWIFMMSSSK
jgi:hypothetical protein